MRVGERYLRINWSKISVLIVEILEIVSEIDAKCKWLINTETPTKIGKEQECSSFDTGKHWKLLSNQDKKDLTQDKSK